MRPQTFAGRGQFDQVVRQHMADDVIIDAVIVMPKNVSHATNGVPINAWLEGFDLAT